MSSVRLLAVSLLLVSCSSHHGVEPGEELAGRPGEPSDRFFGGPGEGTGFDGSSGFSDGGRSPVDAGGLGSDPLEDGGSNQVETGPPSTAPVPGDASTEPPEVREIDGVVWLCRDAEIGLECEGGPPPPAGYAWTCLQMTDGDTVVCEAPYGPLPEWPGWECYETPGGLACATNRFVFPDDRTRCGGTVSVWQCSALVGSGFRCYEWIGDDYSCPGLPRSSACDPGERRWCVPAWVEYVDPRWGLQECQDDGRYGVCLPAVNADGAGLRPATNCACRNTSPLRFDGTLRCCEDTADRDGDGYADCLVPGDYQAPSCVGDGSLCSFCDRNSDCAGPDGFCFWNSGGTHYCTHRCTADLDCGAGYLCEEIRTTDRPPGRQCVPVSTRCEDGGHR